MNSNNYYTTIYGLDPDGNIVLTGNGPEPICMGCGFVITCSAQCNGPDYAFEINQFKKLNNGVIWLSFDRTYEYIDPATNTGVPFYWYMSLTTWNTLTNNNNNPYLLLDHIFVDVGLTGVQDPQGNWLYHDVVGIEKTPGIYTPWVGRSTSPLAQELSCSSDLFVRLNTFMSAMNLYCQNCTPSSNYPTLACNGSAGSPSGQDDPVYAKFKDFEAKFDSLFDTNNRTGGVIPIFPQVSDAIELITAPGTEGRFNPDQIIEFQFTNLSNYSGTVRIPTDSIIQPDSSVSFDNLSLSSGLYRMNIIVDSFSVFPFFFEANQPQNTNSQSLSTFLNVTVFPVPVTNNEFSVQMIGAKRLKYKYTLSDITGQVLLQEPFTIDENEEIIFSTQIDPNLYLPYNMLVNTFTFEDGSTLVIQTIRQTQ